MQVLRKDRRKRSFSLAALLLALGLVVAACGGGSEDTADNVGAGGNGGNGGNGGGGNVPSETINIGWIPWDEDIAVTNLWTMVLENKGYNVESTQLQAGAIYAGLASGDLNVFFDGWLPLTHKKYLEKYGDQLSDLGIWYDQASLEWAVPADSPLDSIADLKGKADTFDGKIIGIDAGAGLTDASKNRVIPDYGLGDSYELVVSSTPSMLAALDKAMSDDEPIVVTLWHPHWAYGAYDIKDLKDPKGALGEAEKIHTFANKGFKDTFPQVAEWFSNFKVDDPTLSDLENYVFQKYKDKPEEEAVKMWMEDNPDFVKSLTSSSGSGSESSDSGSSSEG